MECIVCFEEREPISFPCGHTVCLVCYPKLRRCPLCNYEVIPITPRISHAHHVIELTHSPARDDTRKLQLVCCFIILGIILLSLHKWR
jgi:hypothetical protein